MWTKFGLKLQKNFEIRTSRSQGGGGGWSVISNEGGGGSKKAKFSRTSFMDGPFYPHQKNIVPIKSYAIQYLGHFPRIFISIHDLN